MATSVYSETRPIVQQRVLAIVSGTDPFSVLDWGSDNARIDVLIASSTEAIDHVLTVLINSSEGIAVGSVNIPASAGHGAVPAVDVLAGLPFPLRNGWAQTPAETVEVALEVACVAGEIALVALGGVI
jgi:hypothetical protein